MSYNERIRTKRKLNRSAGHIDSIFVNFKEINDIYEGKHPEVSEAMLTISQVLEVARKAILKLSQSI